MGNWVDCHRGELGHLGSLVGDPLLNGRITKGGKHRGHAAIPLQTATSGMKHENLVRMRAKNDPGIFVSVLKESMIMGGENSAESLVKRSVSGRGKGVTNVAKVMEMLKLQESKFPCGDILNESGLFASTT